MPVSMEDVVRVTMARNLDESRAYLYGKGYKEDEIEEALKATHGDEYAPPVGGQTPVSILNTEPLRGTFIAVAYLLGATGGQLAMLLDIRRSTVFEHVKRRLPDTAERRVLRSKRQITYEGVQVVRSLFYSLARTEPARFGPKPDVVKIAAILDQEIAWQTGDVT